MFTQQLHTLSGGTSFRGHGTRWARATTSLLHTFSAATEEVCLVQLPTALKYGSTWFGRTGRLAASKQRRPFEPALTPSATKLIDCHQPSPLVGMQCTDGCQRAGPAKFYARHRESVPHHTTYCVLALCRAHPTHHKLNSRRFPAAHVSQSQSQRIGRSDGFEFEFWLTGEIASEESARVFNALCTRVGFARFVRLSWC